jgi:hypothetical protein
MLKVKDNRQIVVEQSRFDRVFEMMRQRRNADCHDGHSADD